ncbi:hypothetical protein E2986_00452 [Frieseomelitta varia]|uniref:Ankyrin repeat domain-containing protein n=1 Tax=Frieseomelitta varia TaxID=561572 RepID=A0A833RS25_9HYME|nr:hypothetical protein E2986_00452 [Frieseomelitta varia]
MVKIDTIQKNYPLHWLVWNNNYVELEEELSTKLHDIEKLDNRGRTPLMLAVTLGHIESVGVLLQHEANVNTENTQGWTVVQEAVGTGNPELIQMVLAHRDYQRYCNRVAGIPELLHKLKQVSLVNNKAGLWGWRSDKSEIVNGHECKVFSACNVELITKTRLEHLSEPDKARARAPRTPLQSFLGMAEQQQENSNNATTSEEYNNVGNPSNITAEEYFDPDVDLNGRDIGRPKEVNTKIQKFKATLWLSEQYPLSLQEQIMPIVDLMAISSSHFAKLKDFIQMQLPAGFPVKIEIPLFHILNARITFGNIFGMDQEVPHVGHLQETNRMTCLVDDICFEAPVGYVKLAGAEVRTQFSMEEEDDLLQFAIQQSLLEVGSERDEIDIWEALRAQKPSRPTTPNMTTEEERQLQRYENILFIGTHVAFQIFCFYFKSSKYFILHVFLCNNSNSERAIQASLALCQDSNVGCASGRSNSDKTNDIENADSLEDTAEQLRLALRLSELQQLEEEQRRLLEEETFRQVLELSLTDK